MTKALIRTDRDGASSIEVPVLSVRQPFASTFFDSRPHRFKFCENRTWRTSHRGPLFIHASSLDRKPTKAMLDLDDVDPAARGSILAMWDDPPPTLGLPVGRIIGCVNLWEIIPGETLELLSLTPQASQRTGRLPPEVLECLRPSERACWLERWREVHRWIGREVSERQFLTHWAGPECWMVREPKVLQTPIVTGGKLNIWKLQLPPDRLRFYA